MLQLSAVAAVALRTPGKSTSPAEANSSEHQIALGASELANALSQYNKQSA